MKRLIYILTILFLSLNVSAQTDDIELLDSLVSVYNMLPKGDTSKCGVCRSIAKNHYNVDSTILWANRLDSLSEIHNLPRYKCDALGFLSWAVFYQQNYQESINLNYRGVILADSINYLASKAYHYHMLGEGYTNLKDFKQSDRYCHEALDIFTAIKDTVHIVRTLRTMCTNFNSQRLYEQSYQVCRRCIMLDSMRLDYLELASDMIELASSMVYEYEEQFSDPNPALLSQAKSLVISAIETNDEDFMNNFDACILLSEILFFESRFHNYTGERLQEVVDSLRGYSIIVSQIADKVGTPDYYMDLARTRSLIFILQRNFPKALQILDSISVECTDKSTHDFRNLSLLFREYYLQKGDFKSAWDYNNLFVENLLESLSIDYVVAATQNYAQSEFDHTLRERDQSHRRRAMYVLAALVIILLLSVFITVVFIRNKKHNEILDATNKILVTQQSEIISQKEEIMSQKDELIDKNKQITDSIKYASLIQKAVMPKDYVMTEMFSDYFLIFRPLYIVAGDFYWANRIGDYRVVVCADCTGHGVPGAFVSMLGVSLINEVCPSVIARKGNAADILNELRNKLMQALGQSKQMYENGRCTNMDGMDLSLVMIDDNNNLHYAGAYRPLWIFRNGQLLKFAPDKMPIGLYLGEDKDFTDVYIECCAGDVLYLFSDGISDQFGFMDDAHMESRHFSIKNLTRLVTEIGSKSLGEQKVLIEQAIDNWKNGYQQLDDNIMVGIKL